MANDCLKGFYLSCNLKNFMKKPICFKNLETPTRIDRILTNHPKSFHSSSFYETSLSDFHKLTLMVSKIFHAKHKPKIIQYRDFSHFDNASFGADILQEVSLQNVQSGELKNLNTFPRKYLIFMLQ